MTINDTYQAPPLPKAFIWRRAHSFTGIWLVLFLIEHLLTNSQAALLIGEDGNGFVRAVNWIQELPYLHVIELTLLGIPFLIHGIWGVKYLFQAKYNVFPSDGSTPSLPQYPRNQAYTWQRITSWILLFGILAHVIHMRFIEYPASAQWNNQKVFLVALERDNGLYTLSKRLGVDLYNTEQLQAMKQEAIPQTAQTKGSEETPEQLIEAQSNRESQAWLKALDQWELKDNHVLAIAKSFGVAELLIVRDTFKSPMMIFLYTGLVIAACFHAFNGLWTFMIAWGITLTAASQNLMRKLAVFLMLVITFLGLASIWGTYWLNLTY